MFYGVSQQKSINTYFIKYPLHIFNMRLGMKKKSKIEKYVPHT
jgi:hypothetical protein